MSDMFSAVATEAIEKLEALYDGDRPRSFVQCALGYDKRDFHHSMAIDPGKYRAYVQKRREIKVLEDELSEMLHLAERPKRTKTVRVRAS